MRKREIAKFVRDTGENPVRQPGSRNVPSPGDFDFDRKLREYNRWVEEYEYGESLVATVPLTWTPCQLEADHNEPPITDAYAAKNPRIFDRDGDERRAVIYRQSGRWQCFIDDADPFTLRASTLEQAKREAVCHLNDPE